MLSISGLRSKWMKYVISHWSPAPHRCLWTRQHPYTHLTPYSSYEEMLPRTWRHGLWHFPPHARLTEKFLQVIHCGSPRASVCASMALHPHRRTCSAHPLCQSLRPHLRGGHHCASSTVLTDSLVDALLRWSSSKCVQFKNALQLGSFWKWEFGHLVHWVDKSVGRNDVCSWFSTRRCFLLPG